MARLIVSRGDVLHCEFELLGKDVTIGSDSGDDVRLADAAISGRHAELRFQEGQYVIYDLGSESGVWVNGQRVSQATLAPGVSFAIGPFRARVDFQPRPNPAAVDAPTLYAGQSPQLTKTDAIAPAREDRITRPSAGAVGADAPTMYAQPAQPAADAARRVRAGQIAAPSAAAPAVARSKKDTKGSQAAPQVSLVARIARLPKPVLFGGVSFLLILILALRVLTAPTNDASRSTSATVSAGEPRPAAPSNEQTIASHLESGRARNKRGEYEAAIREDFDPVLLIDKTNAEALSLKAEAEEGLKKQKPSEPSREETATADSPPSVPERVAETPQSRTVATAGRVSADSLLNLYNQAIGAIHAEDYSGAATALERIISENPRYRDAAIRLGEVRQAQAERAKVALDAALSLEQDDELIKARSAVERACAMPQASSACVDASKRIAEKIQSSGNDAFRRARVFDGQGRLPEAIALYERAFQFLAVDDANRQIAKERLEFLKSHR